MVSRRSKADKKINYDKKICSLIDQYSKVLVVNADNVGSNQLQQIRHALRGDSVVLMGKNTMMKRSIRVHAEETGNKDILNIIPQLVRNVGLIFTKGNLKEVKDVVSKYKVGAPARVGTVAPDDVVVKPGNTGLDPSQTGFFQVLNIATKINKGTVEIITPVEIIKKGEKVGSSEAVLLTKLGIKPFSYGLKVVSVFEEGTVYGPEILDLTDEDLEAKFMMGVAEVTALSLAVAYPSILAASHYFANAYKNLLAIAVETDYSFKEAEEVKEFVKDPSKFIAATVAGAMGAGSTQVEAVEEEKKEEVKDESDEEEGLSGLFD